MQAVDVLREELHRRGVRGEPGDAPLVGQYCAPSSAGDSYEALPAHAGGSLASAGGSTYSALSIHAAADEPEPADAPPDNYAAGLPAPLAQPNHYV